MPSINPLPSDALNPSLIRQAVDAVCRQFNDEQREWSFRVASATDLRKWRGEEPLANAKNGYHQPARYGDESLLYGVGADPKSVDLEGPSALDGAYEAFATFYMAYSTWDGRVLYLDRVGVPDGEKSSEVDLALRRVLARVAIRLECTRFTWQQWGVPNLAPEAHPSNKLVPRPEHLEGWLTLHWSRPSMIEFLGGRSSFDGLPASAGEGMRNAIARSLAMLHEQNLSSADDESSTAVRRAIRLRLAALEDVEAIGRLVKGLADFEKEPDAVHVTDQHYKLDGFGDGSSPLFYCLLLDSDDDRESPNGSYTLGMALVNVQESISAGRFLYLEDLFIEEPYRGQGGGSLVMKALAATSLSLGCSRMVWQALHWNTPALAFYGKLGAKVQAGLETLRYTGAALTHFAKY